ncbi:MAG: hypothetical protein M1834_004782 [Cirrosporium novae-zelandiae]|nr:MAG: hypothetical protein M1834_004782 [Cirrosporium novae-zelandiae]
MPQYIPPPWEVLIINMMDRVSKISTFLCALQSTCTPVSTKPNTGAGQLASTHYQYPWTGDSILPVIDENFPDPAIIQVNDSWYAFSTNNDNLHIPFATSTDFGNWNLTEIDALPTLPKWAMNKGIWAPDVVQLDDGSFVMYYCANMYSNPRKHCVGAAMSLNIQGPYIPREDVFACPLDQGGAIDPAGFQDTDGQRYVVYKVDGNSNGHGGVCGNTVPPIQPTPIMLQAVEADGITPQGDPVEILDRIDADGPLIEAPDLIKTSDGKYVLSYSSNCFTTPNYDVNYAVADQITGPYTRAEIPLLKTGFYPDLIGPGGAAINPDGTKMAFHGILDKHGPDPRGLRRGLYTANISILGGIIEILNIF